MWGKCELEKLLLICREHNVLILSDEAHADWALFGNKFIPMGSIALPHEVVTLAGPSKTFALPGLAASFLIIQDESLRWCHREYGTLTLALTPFRTLNLRNPLQQRV